MINEKSPHSGDILGAYRRIWFSKKHVSCGLQPPLICFFGEPDSCAILPVYHQSVVIFLIYSYPDQSAVEIQYAAVYTEGILPSIQCTCSIYTANLVTKIRITILHIHFNIVAVYLQYILQTSWSVHSVYTATIPVFTLFYFAVVRKNVFPDYRHVSVVELRRVEPCPYAGNCSVFSEQWLFLRAPLRQILPHL